MLEETYNNATEKPYWFLFIFCFYWIILYANVAGKATGMLLMTVINFYKFKTCLKGK